MISVVRLAIDENFNNDILRGLLRRRPETDAVRVQDVGLQGADDPTVLEWAALEDRVLLTHDAATLIRYARQRVAKEARMPGVIEVNRRLAIGEAIEELLLIVECADSSELEDRIWFVPL